MAINISNPTRLANSTPVARPKPQWPSTGPDPTNQQEPFRHRRPNAPPAKDEATERAELAGAADDLMRIGSLADQSFFNLADVRDRVLSGEMSTLDAEEVIGRERAAAKPRLAPITAPGPSGGIAATQPPLYMIPVSQHGMVEPAQAVPLPTLEEIKAMGLADAVYRAATGGPVLLPIPFGLAPDGTVIDYEGDERTEIFKYLAEQFTGRPVVMEPLHGRSGGYVTFTDSLPEEVHLATDLDYNYETEATLPHEASHPFFETLVDDPEARRKLEILRPRLYQLFADVNAWPVSPENPTYADVFLGNGYDFAPDGAVEVNVTTRDVGRLREGLAEFFRMYTDHPAYLYKHYPDLVQTIANLVNTNERLSPFIRLE